MSNKRRTEQEGISWPKATGLLLVVIIASAISWYTWTQYTAGLPEEPPQMADRPAPPNPEEMRARADRMMTEIGVTDEQAEQLRALMQPPEPGQRPNPGDMQARREQMAEILTPEQMQAFESQMRQGMQQRMAERMERDRERLSDEDFAALQERMRERMEQGGPGGPGGPGGGGPGSGGPPPGM